MNVLKVSNQNISHKMTSISQKFHGNILFNFPPTSPTWTLSPFRFVAAPTTLVQICQSSLLLTISKLVQADAFYLRETSGCLEIFGCALQSSSKRKNRKNQHFIYFISLFFGLSRHMVPQSNSTSSLRRSGCTNEATQLSSCLERRLITRMESEVFFLRG